MKKILCTLIASLCLIAGCQSNDKDVLRVGVISGPESDLLNVAKKVAFDKYGLKVKSVVFNDYTLPNTALADGSIDANVFQHLPYLKATNKARGYDLVSVGKTFIFPMRIYSKKYKSIQEFPEGTTVAIPNDPTNEARALQLFQDAGLIKLNDDGDFTTVKNISSNPKKLKFKTLDAAQLPRVLDDVTAAAINTTYAITAGLKPSEDAIFSEGLESKYANIIAVRKKEATDERIKEFVAAYQSDEVKSAAKNLFGDEAIAAWGSRP